MTLYLASQSPRRRSLLALAGWSFEACAANIDESPLPAERPADYVLRLARAKARTAAQSLAGSSRPLTVLASDTTVADGDHILGKPEGKRQAEAMLRRLAGRAHTVYTAVAVCQGERGEPAVELCASQVVMRAYSDAEIDAYIATGDPFDKAGGYAIQHAGFHPVERVEGCYPSVMGLPVCRVNRLLEAAGLRRSPEGLDCPGPQGGDAHCPIWRAVQELA